LEWLSSSVAWHSSSLVCGNLPPATLLAQQVSPEHSILSHQRTQVMAAAAIIKTWTVRYRMILCGAVLRASQSAVHFIYADMGAEAYSGVLLTIYLLCAAFTSYGAFWLSFATLLIPSSGVGDAYGTDVGMELDAIGIYLIAWMIVTFLFL
jgi:hypothetical protein